MKTAGRYMATGFLAFLILLVGACGDDRNEEVLSGEGSLGDSLVETEVSAYFRDRGTPVR